MVKSKVLTFNYVSINIFYIFYSMQIFLFSFLFFGEDEVEEWGSG